MSHSWGSVDCGHPTDHYFPYLQWQRIHKYQSIRLTSFKSHCMRCRFDEILRLTQRLIDLHQNPLQNIHEHSNKYKQILSASSIDFGQMRKNIEHFHLKSLPVATNNDMTSVFNRLLCNVKIKNCSWIVESPFKSCTFGSSNMQY